MLAVRRVIVPAVMVLLIGGVTRGASSRAAPQSTVTPFQRFERLLPVIRHPRCMNCHGALDPGTTSHPGGAITTEACEGCHGDAQDWRIPHQNSFFINKTDRQLCALFANIAEHMGYEQFISGHIVSDELIKLAFDGVMGGARTPGAGSPPDPPPDKPPMDHAEFTRWAKEWVSDGRGACDVEGTITQVESVDVDTVFYPFPGRAERFAERATRTVTVTANNDDSYTARIETSGTIVLTLMTETTYPSGRACTLVITDSSTISGLTTGPARVRIKDTVFFAGTDPRAGQTDYRIDVTLPPEHTQRIDRNMLVEPCGSTLQAVPPETLNTTWPRHDFAIEGHLDDRTQPNLVGGCTKVVKSADVARMMAISETPCFRFANIGNKQEPWLMHHEGSGAYADGTDIPHRVTTSWNITYRR
jgi:hypothetical protein